MLGRLASCDSVPWLKNAMSDTARELVWNRAHQLAGIRGITDRRVALSFWAWEIAMFGVIAGDNNAFVGAAFVNFSDASGVVAVHDAF
jgi:hypothetical protein